MAKLRNFQKFIIHSVIIIVFICYLFSADYIFNQIITVKGEAKLYNFDLPESYSNILFALGEVNQTKIGWKDVVRFDGWAFVERVNAKNQKIFLVLKSESNKYIFDTVSEYRIDLPVAFKVYDMNLQNAGFNSILSKDVIKDGVYCLGFCLKNNGETYFSYSNHYFTKSGDAFFQTPY